jgi:uncharacterized membrane protein YraQ (UPF0718 family)
VFVISVLVGRFVALSHRRKLTEPWSEGVECGRVSDRHKMSHGQLGPWATFRKNSLGIAEHVLLYFLLGILVASAVSVLTGGSFFSTLLGAQRWFAIPLAGVLAIPLYMCGGAVIPMLAVGGASGMSQGAILAFLIVGPSTRITPLVGMCSIFTKRALAFYAAFVICFAILSGLIYDALLRLL